MKTKVIIYGVLLGLAGGGTLYLHQTAADAEREMEREHAVAERRGQELQASLARNARESAETMYRIEVDAAEASARYSIQSGEPRTAVETLKELKIANARARRDEALAKAGK